MTSLLFLPLMMAPSAPELFANAQLDPLLTVIVLALAALVWVALMAAVQLGGALLLLRAAAARVARTI